MELSPEERQKIYLEEKARLEIEALSNKASAGTVIGRIVLGLFCLVILLFVIGSMTENSEKAKSTAAVANQITGNPAHDRLTGLGANAQAQLLGQIAGEGCSGDSAFYMGMDKETNAYWSVRCSSGRSYQVQIKPNTTGSTRIMDCDLLKAVAKVSCFMKLDQQ